MAEVKKTVSITTVKTSTVELTEDEVADVLREHFKMPNARVDFVCGDGYLKSVEIVHREESTLEEPR